MREIETIEQALVFLNDGEILTTNNKNQFILKDKKIHCYDDGSHFVVKIEDFLSLYKNALFYIYEDDVEIDENKDEAYYRYYKK